MQQAAVLDGLPFDPFPLHEDCLTAPKVDVGRRQVADALVVTKVIVVGDEGIDLSLEVAGQIVVLEQDAVLWRLVPALDLALGHGVIGERRGHDPYPGRRAIWRGRPRRSSIRCRTRAGAGERLWPDRVPKPAVPGRAWR